MPDSGNGAGGPKIEKVHARAYTGRSKSLGEFRTVFEGRLGAFARAHSNLLEADWEGAELGGLVRSAIEAHAADPARFVISGPALHVSPKQALAVSLVLHELETNAAKYGALSGEDGRVKVRWRLEDAGDVRLTWQEMDGPPVRNDVGEGFGTRLIRDLMR